MRMKDYLKPVAKIYQVKVPSMLLETSMSVPSVKVMPLEDDDDFDWK